eukprot:COSAG02_NODE_7337_length_3057_cov_75.754226_1_plen_65_part_00
MMSGPKPVSLAADSSADCISLPVLVITLKQREDRRRFIDAHLLGSGVSYECAFMIVAYSLGQMN